jgi:hypothetical protein
MAQRNKAVTEVVAWRRKREIKACPESLLELRRRREQRLVRSDPSLVKFRFAIRSRIQAHRVCPRNCDLDGYKLDLQGGATSVIGLGFRRCALAQLNPFVAQFDMS